MKLHQNYGDRAIRSASRTGRTRAAYSLVAAHSLPGTTHAQHSTPTSSQYRATAGNNTRAGGGELHCVGGIRPCDLLGQEKPDSCM